MMNFKTLPNQTSEDPKTTNQFVKYETKHEFGCNFGDPFFSFDPREECYEFAKIRFLDRFVEYTYFAVICVILGIPLFFFIFSCFFALDFLYFLLSGHLVEHFSVILLVCVAVSGIATSFILYFMFLCRDGLFAYLWMMKITRFLDDSHWRGVRIRLYIDRLDVLRKEESEEIRKTLMVSEMKSCKVKKVRRRSGVDETELMCELDDGGVFSVVKVNDCVCEDAVEKIVKMIEVLKNRDWVSRE